MADGCAVDEPGQETTDGGASDGVGRGGAGLQEKIFCKLNKIIIK
jgi:hypothetical protein